MKNANRVHFTFACRRPSLRGFREILWAEFSNSKLLQLTILFRTYLGRTALNVLSPDATNETLVEKQTELLLLKERDQSSSILKFCNAYSDSGSTLLKTYNICIISRNGKQLTIPV